MSHSYLQNQIDSGTFEFEFMKRCRWSARSVSRKCASSHSSPMPVPCARFWITSVNPPRRPASLRRVGRRCGIQQFNSSRCLSLISGLRGERRDEKWVSFGGGYANGLRCAVVWGLRGKLLPWGREISQVCRGKFGLMWIPVRVCFDFGGWISYPLSLLPNIF